MENIRHIPDYFTIKGKPICSLSSWEEKRELLKKQFLDYMYGNITKKLTPSVSTEQNSIDFGGKASWESVFFTFENNGSSHTVRTDLILPRDKSCSPVFLYLSFAREIPNKYLPVEEIIDNGFGIFTFCYEDVTSDNNDFSNGLASLLEGDFGKISVWAYMASVCMDYLCTRSEVNKDSVAIIGHSRLGKTALLASALDERFLLTCSNDSGCCGAALTRSKPTNSESLDDILRVFPFWFTPLLKKYVNEPNALPFDQHMLLSLIAPRYLVIGTASKDHWADNEGQLLACGLATRAWELYKKQGLVRSSLETKSSFELLEGEVSFFQREGTHFLSRTDWLIYMKKFKEIIK